MPRPSLRSRSLRRTKVRRPGGRLVTRYSRKKPSPARCGNCGARLSGVPRARPSGIAKLSKSSRRPTRPYGGNLCPSCTREAIKIRFFK